MIKKIVYKESIFSKEENTTSDFEVERVSTDTINSVETIKIHYKKYGGEKIFDLSNEEFSVLLELMKHMDEKYQ